MAQETDSNKYASILEQIIDDGMGGMTGVIVTLLNEAMKLDRNRHLQASDYERTSERQGYANGYKAKSIASRLGKLELDIPQVRSSGSVSFFL